MSSRTARYRLQELPGTEFRNSQTSGTPRLQELPDFKRGIVFGDFPETLQGTLHNLKTVFLIKPSTKDNIYLIKPSTKDNIYLKKISMLTPC